MLRSLIIENVRSTHHLEVNFPRGGGLCLSGRNGAGKTTILEALSFAFTGRDSSGGQSPSHLIGPASDSMKTVLTTEWGTISRTLTKKKNGTLKVSRQGLVFYPSQTELRHHYLTWSDPVLLAATVPGYFMSQTENNRFALLSEVTPRFDRYQIMSNLSGIPLEEIKLLGNLDTKIPHYTHFSHKRLELQKQRAKNEGQMMVYRASIDTSMEQPVLPAQQVALLEQMDRLAEIWKNYQNAVLDYPHKKAVYDSIVTENAKRAERAKNLFETLSSITLEDEIEFDYGMFPNLNRDLPPPPDKPAYHHIPDFSDCPTCGQVVGDKHKGRMREANENMKLEYEKKLADYHVLKADLIKIRAEEQLRMDDLYAKSTQVKESNKYKARQKQQIMDDIRRCEPMQLPQEPVFPEAPAQAYDRKTHNDLIAMKQQYFKDLGAYDKMISNRMVAAGMIRDLELENEELGVRIAKFEDYEDAIRKLPAEEAKLKKEFFSLKNFTVDITDVIQISSIKHGVPYECLSAGERMLANFEICLQFQTLMKNFPGYIFIDNADLTDWSDLITPPENILLLLANVDPEQNTLFITER